MRKGIIYVYFNRVKYEKEGIEKYYVGQTIGTTEQRAKKDGRGYGWANPNCNNKFARSIRKWGWNAFECKVLEEVYEEDLNELEKFYIEQFDSYKNGYNTTRGGEGVRGFNHNEETKKKISVRNKKRFQDKNEREKISEKMSVVAKNRWKDKEEREKQSKAQRKRYKDPKERQKCSQPGKKNGMYGKGYKIAGELSTHTKKVYCKELNIVFSYVKLAEKYCINILKIKIGPISGTCNGRRKSTGRYNGTKLTWKYIEDVNQETLDKAEYIDSKKYEELLSQNVNDCNKLGA